MSHVSEFRNLLLENIKQLDKSKSTHPADWVYRRRQVLRFIIGVIDLKNGHCTDRLMNRVFNLYQRVAFAKELLAGRSANDSCEDIMKSLCNDVPVIMDVVLQETRTSCMRNFFFSAAKKQERALAEIENRFEHLVFAVKLLKQLKEAENTDVLEKSVDPALF